MLAVGWTRDGMAGTLMLTLKDAERLLALAKRPQTEPGEWPTEAVIAIVRAYLGHLHTPERVAAVPDVDLAPEISAMRTALSATTPPPSAWRPTEAQTLNLRRITAAAWGTAEGLSIRQAPRADVRAEIDAVVKQIVAALSATTPPPSAWRGIESAPRDGTPIIGGYFNMPWADSHAEGRIVKCWYQPEFDAFISSCRQMTMAPGYTITGKSSELHSPVIERVTHYMPLPSPPKDPT